MNLDRTLLQRSYLFFVIFLLLAVAAFWFTYWTRLGEQENYRMHLHGIALFLWCVMLITQAILARSNRNALHRNLGRLSYFLIPFMVLTTLDLLKYKVDHLASPSAMDYWFISLVLNAVIALLIFYVLAIKYRKVVALHSRFMVSTVFPMFTPVTDRLIAFYIPGLKHYLPVIEGNPIRPVAGFILCDALLLLLCITDWKSKRTRWVFPFVLAVMLLYHYSVMNFYRFGFWQSFGQWFINF